MVLMKRLKGITSIEDRRREYPRWIETGWIAAEDRDGEIPRFKCDGETAN